MTDVALKPVEEKTIRLMTIASRGVTEYLVYRGLQPTEAEWQAINRTWCEFSQIQVDKAPGASDVDLVKALATIGITVCVLVLDPRNRGPKSN